MVIRALAVYNLKLKNWKVVNMLHILVLLLIIVLGIRILDSCSGCLILIGLGFLTLFLFKWWIVWLGIALIVFLFNL